MAYPTLKSWKKIIASKVPPADGIWLHEKKKMSKSNEISRKLTQAGPLRNGDGL